MFKYCSKCYSYFLLFALQGNTTTNGGADNSLCANNIQIPQGDSKTYFCSPKAYGRYLYIRLLRQMALTLCEVEVYSYLKSESKSPFPSSCLFYRYAWCLCVYLLYQFFFGLLLKKSSVLKIVLYSSLIKSFCIFLINLFIFLLWCLPNLIEKPTAHVRSA